MKWKITFQLPRLHTGTRVTYRVSGKTRHEAVQAARELMGHQYGPIVGILISARLIARLVNMGPLPGYDDLEDCA